MEERLPPIVRPVWVLHPNVAQNATLGWGIPGTSYGRVRLRSYRGASRSLVQRLKPASLYLAN